ncbi:MAG TPA: hypothetical protein VG845_13130 [Dehalococcoidia bacterium]|jgi:hypothetical protein|nr:hypothetical protein [Dehalococcoidia bacterium]
METSLALAPSWPRPRLLAVLVAGVLVAASLFGAQALEANLEIGHEPYQYDIVAWEIENLPGKWLYELGALFRTGGSEAENDAELRRFFALTDEIDDLEGAARDADAEAALEAKRRERDRLENRVEATIESRVTAALEREGITYSPFILPRAVWPPVDFEFTHSPRNLAISPRSRIELQDSYLLRLGLSLDEVEAIEAEREARDGVSALSFETGGVGAYPTLITYSDSYRATLERVAHEWAHNHLFFRPLGFNYYESTDLRTMNETVADLIGHEIAEAVIAEWPLDQESPSRGSERRGTSVDVGAALRQLRGEVDALLAAGRVEEAEALMEQRRQELLQQGVYLRKINQAFFAFTNLYAGEAGNPGATNPIGPKIDELRRRSNSLREFVDTVAGITSVRELDRVLAAAEE